MSPAPAPTFTQVPSRSKLLLAHRTSATPRARRGAAAVIAQYIQDLTHPSDPAPGAAAA